MICIFPLLPDAECSEESHFFPAITLKSDFILLFPLNPSQHNQNGLSFLPFVLTYFNNDFSRENLLRL